MKLPKKKKRLSLKMKLYDISMEIREDMPVYKNKEEKKPKIIHTKTLEQGANESRLEIESHIGTHADAFFHMLAKGKTIDKIELGKFIGECIVLDFSNIKEKVTMKDLLNKEEANKHNFESNKSKNSPIIRKKDIVLLKTRSKPMEKFDFSFTYLEKSGAEFLASKKVKCIGIDNLGIERSQPQHETHKILFEKNIPVVEGLELSKIKQGRYFFIGLPLKIEGGDGSPIRAVLIEKQGIFE